MFPGHKSHTIYEYFFSHLRQIGHKSTCVNILSSAFTPLFYGKCIIENIRTLEHLVNLRNFFYAEDPVLVMNHLTVRLHGDSYCT